MPEHSLRRIGSRLTFCVILLLGCTREQAVLDEASRAGRTAGSFPAADEDYFRDMDSGVRPEPRRRSRGATPGSCGRAATTASGTA